MKRRYLLKSLGLGCASLGLAPNLLARTTQGYFLGETYRSGSDDGPKDYLQKIQNFNKPHNDDVQIDNNLYGAFESTVMKMRRL